MDFFFLQEMMIRPYVTMTDPVFHSWNTYSSCSNISLKQDNIKWKVKTTLISVAHKNHGWGTVPESSFIFNYFCKYILFYYF